MDSKVIICGTGRAGTTLLVRILTIAGIDTGFRPRHIRNAENNIGRAGLERKITKDNVDHLPTVIKSPNLVNVLPEILREKWFPVGLAIVPVRNLEGAAQSRISVNEKAISKRINPGHAPGGLWKTDAPENQHWVLAEQFYRTIEPLVAANVPYIIVSFPRFAQDAEYFDEVVSSELERRFNWDRKKINEAYISECRPELISKFEEKVEFATAS